jgi:glycosyltransferase involved in cell wall biosynthesis
MARVVCFGPGPRFKGGLSQYNTSLAKAFDALGAEVTIISWSQQYPAIVPRDFIDRASRNDHLHGTGIQVQYLTNYNNPFSWLRTARAIAALKPDLVVFQWSIALQGLPIGWIVRWLKRNTQIEVVMDIHFVVQKENSRIDRSFSKYGLSKADSYIVHAFKTADELKTLFPKKQFSLTEDGTRAKDGSHTVIKLYHPIYDIYQPDPNFKVELEKAALGLRGTVFFFFGFIRKYKGLHNVLPAFDALAKEREDVSLLVVGESFWQTLDSTKWTTRLKKAVFGFAKKQLTASQDDEQNYRPLELIESLGIADRVVVVNRYVGNEEVPRYFQVADCMLLFYEYATPSGVESMAYNFRLPVIATNVGHFPETVEEGMNGYLVEAENIEAMTAGMRRFLAHPVAREGVDDKARHLSWQNYALAILNR